MPPAAAAIHELPGRWASDGGWWLDSSPRSWTLLAPHELDEAQAPSAEIKQIRPSCPAFYFGLAA